MAQYSPSGVPLPTPKPINDQAQSGTPQPDSSPDLRTGWQEFLSHPENRAGLLQFGLSMLNPPNPGGSFASNVGGALSEGVAARGAAVQRQENLDIASAKLARDEESRQSLITLRKAQTARALRGPAVKTPSTSGTLTQKDYAKEWIKYVKGRRSEDPELSIADLKKEFNEVWAEASGTPATPATPAAATGVTAAQINQMTLDQLKALDTKTLDPATLQAASTRYQQLSKGK